MPQSLGRGDHVVYSGLFVDTHPLSVSWHLFHLKHHYSFVRWQETCIYRRLNAALRSRDMRILEPFLPYMKLLLSALYQLPLVQVPTYRGVKRELFEASDNIPVQT